MSNVPIVYISDNNYVMPTVVSIISLLKNKKKDAEYKIYVVGINLSKENLRRLKEISCVTVLNLDNKYKDLDTEHIYVSKTALFKFDLAEIFKEYDKILYLDSDTVILKDLSELLNISVEDYYAGVVKDILAVLRGDAKVLGFEDNDYFNSGMMLLNAKKIREENVQKKLLETKIKLSTQTKRYMDQDAFNVVFKDKVKFLHPNFNYLRSNTKWKKGTIKSFFKIKKINPVIIHLTYLKPWIYKNTQYAPLWRKYYKISPYKDVKLNLQMHKEPFKIYFKRKFNDRWIIDFLGLRFSYKKGGRDFRLFYP